MKKLIAAVLMTCSFGASADFYSRATGYVGSGSSGGCSILDIVSAGIALCIAYGITCMILEVLSKCITIKSESLTAIIGFVIGVFSWLSSMYLMMSIYHSIGGWVYLPLLILAAYCMYTDK